MGLYHLVVYEWSLQVQVVIKSKQHAHLRLVHTGLQRTLKNKYFANMCTPIIDGHAVYFLLLPGPGGIVHKLLSGISPLVNFIQNLETYSLCCPLFCQQWVLSAINCPLFWVKFSVLSLTECPLPNKLRVDHHRYLHELGHFCTKNHPR